MDRKTVHKSDTTYYMRPPKSLEAESRVLMLIFESLDIKMSISRSENKRFSKGFQRMAKDYV